MGLTSSSLFCCCKNEDEGRESNSRSLRPNSPWNGISTPATGRISHSSSRLSHTTDPFRSSNASTRTQWVVTEQPQRRISSRREDLSAANPRPAPDPASVTWPAFGPVAVVPPARQSFHSRERPELPSGQILKPDLLAQPPLQLQLHSIYQRHLGPFNPRIDMEVLEENSPDYNLIHRKFMTTTQAHYRVHQIERVNNMFLRLFYLLKKEEYDILYGRNNVKEQILFHGTTSENISEICVRNFNWRFHKRQCLFGKGVNFSEISNYASNYSEKTELRVMIAAKVLCCHSCDGTNNMVLPPYLNMNKKIRFDTSQKPDGNVTVKYNDDEFYPEYIIYFTGETRKKNTYY